MMTKLGLATQALIAGLIGTGEEHKWPDHMLWGSVQPSLGYQIKEVAPVRAEVVTPRQVSAELRAYEIRVSLRNPGGYILDGTESDSFRVFRFTQDGVIHSSAVEPPRVRVLDAVAHTLAIRVPDLLLGHSKDDRFGVLALAHKDSPPEHVWIACARSYNAPPNNSVSFDEPTCSFDVSPAQKLVDGRTTPVARAQVILTARNLLPVSDGVWTDLTLDATIATERFDPHAAGELELRIGRRFGANDFGSADFHIGVRGNQSGRAYGSYAVLNIGGQLSAKSVYRPSPAVLIGSGPVTRLGLHVEQRWKRDTDFAPYHASPQVGYASLSVNLGPIWAFPRDPRQGSSRTDCSIWLDLRGYYFPNDSSQSGFATRSFEGYAGVELELPARLLVWVPAVYLRTGAIDAQTFARTVQWGLELRARF